MVRCRTGQRRARRRCHHGPPMTAGTDDLLRAAEALAARVPQPLAGLARLAYNYRWSWTAGGPELFSSIDPVRWERCGENPVRLLGEVDAATLERAASDPAVLEGIAAVEAAVRADLDAPRGRGPGQPRAPDRVLLRRVRRAPLAARLLGRPRRARGRHPQGGVRPRAPARRDRAHVPPGLLPPAHRRRRLAARVLGRHGSRAAARRARHRRRRRAAHGHRARARHAGHGADLARRRRPRAALPARRRASRERPRGALDHLAPVHRRARRAARAVHPPRRRRDPRARGAGDRAGHPAPQRGPRGVHGARAGARAGRPARRRPRGRARQDDLHHPHPRARRQRHVPRRAGDRGAQRPDRGHARATPRRSSAWAARGPATPASRSASASSRCARAAPPTA